MSNMQRVHRCRHSLGCCEHRGVRLFVQEAAGLVLPEAGVSATKVEELLVGALLDDLAAVENDEPVHPGDGSVRWNIAGSCGT
jgi:hypothetical protein